MLFDVLKSLSDREAFIARSIYRKDIERTEIPRGGMKTDDVAGGQ